MMSIRCLAVTKGAGNKERSTQAPEEKKHNHLKAESAAKGAEEATSAVFVYNLNAVANGLPLGTQATG